MRVKLEIVDVAWDAEARALDRISCR